MRTDSMIPQPNLRAQRAHRLLAPIPESRIFSYGYSDSGISLISPHSAEHVLKPSASTSGISLRASSTHSLAPPTLVQRANMSTYHGEGSAVHRGPVHYTNQINPNDPYNTSAIKKPSPTPSVRYRKAARLVQEHGSPPGIRVTAGGRIVPTGIPRLPSPRYVPGAYRREVGAQVAAHQPVVVGALPSLPNGTLLPAADGQQFQYIDGVLRPVSVGPVGGTWAYATPPNSFLPTSTQPFMLYPNIPSKPAIPEYSAPAPHAGILEQVSQLYQGDLTKQVQYLKDSYNQKLEEEKGVLRQEVMEDHNGLLDQTRKAYWVEQKMALRTQTDNIRKSIKVLEAQIEEQKNESGQSNEMARNQQMAQGDSRFVPPQPSLVSFPPMQFPTVVPTHTEPNQPGWTSETMRVFFPGVQLAPPTRVSSLQENQDVQQFATADVPRHRPVSIKTPSSEWISRLEAKGDKQSPPDPVPRPRRSHAIEIKDPRSSAAAFSSQIKKSSLDPTSPTYQPGKPFGIEDHPPPVFIPPEPSPIPSPEPNEMVQAQSPWLFEKHDINRSPDSSKVGNTGNNHSSISTASTADFFPYNTQEHSSRAPLKHLQNMAALYPQSDSDGYALSTPKKTTTGSQVCSPLSEDPYILTAPNVSPVDSRPSSWRERRQPKTITPHLSRSSTGERGTRVERQASTEFDNELLMKLAGKSAAYIRGYHAGLFGIAPEPTKEKENSKDDFLRGYCDGLWSTNRASGKQRGSLQHMYDSPAAPRESRSLRPTLMGSPTETSVHSQLPSPCEMRRSQEPSGLGTYMWADRLAITPTASSFDQNAALKFGLDDSTKRASASFPSELLPSYSGNQLQHIGSARVPNGKGPIGPDIKQQRMSTRVNPIGAPAPRRERSLYRSFDGAADDLVGLEISPTTAVAELETGNASTSLAGGRANVPPVEHGYGLPSTTKLSPNPTRSKADTLGSSSPSKPDALRSPTCSSSKAGSPSKRSSVGSPRAKLERIANKVRKPTMKSEYEARATATAGGPGVADDPALMDDEQKRAWKANWRKRFRALKRDEEKEIASYAATHHQPSPAGGAEY